MPRYFFHIGDTDSGLDREGMDLPDHNAARARAAALMGEILQHKAGDFEAQRSIELIVTDETELVVFELNLTARAPTAGRQR